MSKHGRTPAGVNMYVKEFLKVMEGFTGRHSHYDVFSDWCVMASASLYSFRHDPAIENEYLASAKRYTKAELELHSRLLAITVEALQSEPGDFLGEAFSYAELTNDRTGQFFTPYNISEMMAKMTVTGQLPEANTGRVLKVSDPCCGAGGMLIAASQAMAAQGIDYQHDVLFVAKDIDPRCCRMAFIQLSLLACPAIVIYGDTLAMTTAWERETIGYWLADMESRLKIERMVNTVRELLRTESTPQETKPVSVVADISKNEPVPGLKLEYAVQGELF